MSSSTPDLSIIIPTRNRGDILADTLRRVLALPGSFEVLIVDNASNRPLGRFDDARVQLIHLNENRGAAARNVAALVARGRVLVMLDDDSWPDPGVLEALPERFDRDSTLGAIACRVRLADQPGRHDAGGVPGVFFNCGAAIRRDAFLAAGGFPDDYGYYVEEYALACELWRRGLRVEAHGDLTIWHRRTAANRDNNRMLRFLVRNNCRLWRRYAPASLERELLDQTIERYRRVARLENAMTGFEQGLAESQAEGQTTDTARLSIDQFECLFGLSDARRILRDWTDKHHIRCAAVWGRGKGCEQIISAMDSLGIAVAAVYDSPRAIDGEREWRGLPLRSSYAIAADVADGIVVGSLSPGASEDALADVVRACRLVPAVRVTEWKGPSVAGDAPAKSASRRRPRRRPVAGAI